MTKTKSIGSLLLILGGINKGKIGDKQSESADLANQSLGIEVCMVMRQSIIRVWGDSIWISGILDSNGFKFR